MNWRRWLKNHGLLAALIVLLVRACTATIRAAAHFKQAANLRSHTELLAQRVASEHEAPQPEGEAVSASNGKPGGARKGPQDTDNDPAQIVAKRIAQRNLFTVPPSPQFRNVIGVLGNYALYPGGDMVAVGEMREGAKITAVGADYVEFEFEGETIRVNVLEAGGGPPGGHDGPGPQGGGRSGPPRPDGDRDAMRPRAMERAGEMRNLNPEQLEELKARTGNQSGGASNNSESNGNRGTQP